MTQQARLQIKIAVFVYLAQIVSLPASAQQLLPEQSYLQSNPAAPGTTASGTAARSGSQAQSTETSKPSSTWKPPMRVEVIDVPDAPDSCKLVDIPNEQLNAEITKKQISELEQKLFKREFSAKSIDYRLENLERELFGMGRMGGYNSRIGSISTALLGPEPVKNIPQAILSPDDEFIVLLEKRFYEKDDFSSQPQEERLMRLESLILGKAQSGETHERLLSLKDALKKREEVATAKPVIKASPIEIKSESIRPETSEDPIKTVLRSIREKRYHHAQSDIEQANKMNQDGAKTNADTPVMFKSQ